MKPHQTIAVLLLFLSTACNRMETVPDRTLGAAASPKEASKAAQVFHAALDAIQKGDVEALTSLRAERGARLQSEQFLTELYSRYGRVTRVINLSFLQENGVSRGEFLALHENGPFVWDMILDGNEYTMLRGSTELTPFLRVTDPPKEALTAAIQAIGDLNEGRADAVFPQIVCNCMAADDFRSQVETLNKQAGPEKRRTLVSAESIPGVDGHMVLLHFLSERQNAKLGFHLLMWKTGSAWRINSINWTQEELLPRGIAISKR
jgi:hypothetical protein